MSLCLGCACCILQQRRQRSHVAVQPARVPSLTLQQMVPAWQRILDITTSHLAAQQRQPGHALVTREEGQCIVSMLDALCSFPFMPKGCRSESMEELKRSLLVPPRETATWSYSKRQAVDCRCASLLCTFGDTGWYMYKCMVPSNLGHLTQGRVNR